VSEAASLGWRAASSGSDGCARGTAAERAARSVSARPILPLTVALAIAAALVPGSLAALAGALARVGGGPPAADGRPFATPSAPRPMAKHARIQKRGGAEGYSGGLRADSRERRGSTAAAPARRGDAGGGASAWSPGLSRIRGLSRSAELGGEVVGRGVERRQRHHRDRRWRRRLATVAARPDVGHPARAGTVLAAGPRRRAATAVAGPPVGPGPLLEPPPAPPVPSAAAMSGAGGRRSGPCCRRAGGGGDRRRVPRRFAPIRAATPCTPAEDRSARTASHRRLRSTGGARRCGRSAPRVLDDGAQAARVLAAQHLEAAAQPLDPLDQRLERHRGCTALASTRSQMPASTRHVTSELARAARRRRRAPAPRCCVALLARRRRERAAEAAEQRRRQAREREEVLLDLEVALVEQQDAARGVPVTAGAPGSWR
jgi:hypothetical protein